LANAPYGFFEQPAGEHLHDESHEAMIAAGGSALGSSFSWFHGPVCRRNTCPGRVMRHVRFQVRGASGIGAELLQSPLIDMRVGGGQFACEARSFGHENLGLRGCCTRGPFASSSSRA
jgi:hypothetical protein